MTAINKSTNPKWKILGSSMLCCGRRNKDAAVKISNSPVVSIEEGGGGGSKDVPSTTAVLTKHPSDTNISLSTHQPLYPPGRIIHIVRQHPKASDRQVEELWLSALIVERTLVYS
jgi:sn1-specific diacylglycerol lipase